MNGQMISLGFALLGVATVFGTDVFFCVVGRTALARVGDAALVETMGRLHEVADRRMPIFGVMGIALAMPLVAIGRIAVLRFYVEDCLGDDVGGRATAMGDP